MKCSSVSEFFAPVVEGVKPHQKECIIVALGIAILLEALIGHYMGVNSLSINILGGLGGVMVVAPLIIMCAKTIHKMNELNELIEKVQEVDNNMDLEKLEKKLDVI